MHTYFVYGQAKQKDFTVYKRYFESATARGDVLEGRSLFTVIMFMLKYVREGEYVSFVCLFFTVITFVLKELRFV